ncbi:FAD-dependent oxidoreductase [Neomoorella humiferrea]|uniref:NAD(P)/FAD-dependent oxidoreductase n=1 Tax=Neomoorella humiferrea TaxID=676965 RepID=UPI003D8CA63A
MNNYRDLQIVIIGDGIAGYTAARQLRHLAPEVPVTLIGAEKTQPYSACALPDYLGGYLSKENIFLPPFHGLDGIKIWKGIAAEGFDPKDQRVSAGRQRLPYDKLILATGSVALVPPVPGTRLAGNFTLKTLADVEAILAWEGKSAVVVGSGAIGVEASIALRKREIEVTLIELLDRILPTAFDLEASRLFQKEIEKHGIKVLVGEKVVGVEGKDRVTGVKTSQGLITCDMVIWAAGVRPNTALAQDAGLEIGQFRGIKVNKEMATSVSNIYACGDCVETWDRILKRPGLSLLWASAKEQAAIVAHNCLGTAPREYPGSLGVLIVEAGDVTAVSAGFTEAALKDVGETTISTDMNDKGYTKLITKDGRILGVQFVGSLQGAGAVLAWMQKGTTLSAAREVLSNTIYLKGAPWYYQAARFVS